MRDRRRPLFHWYLDSALGKELVLALFTRSCRYGRCVFCSLPKMSAGGEAVTARDIEKQVDYVLSEFSAAQLAVVRKVSVYTASSSLDRECVPFQSLVYLVARIHGLPELKVLSLESRPEYVEEPALMALRNVLGERIRLEVGIGYETRDPVLRNEILRKGLSVESLRALMRRLAKHGVMLKCYVMLKPHHSLTEDQAVQEALDSLDDLVSLGREFGVPVSIHLNATYIAAGSGIAKELVAQRYQTPELASVIKVMLGARERGLLIYAGLDDEGMAIRGGTFRSTGLNRGRAVAALRAFNRHQDPERLVREAGCLWLLECGARASRTVMASPERRTAELPAALRATGADG